MNTRKIILYCIFTFGISWFAALLLHFSGIDYGGVASTIIIALLYMPGPAIATLIVQKGIYKQSLQDYNLQFKGISTKWILMIPLIFLGLLISTYLFIYIGSLIDLRFGQIIFSGEYIGQQLSSLIAQNTGVESIQIPELPAGIFIAYTLIGGIVGGFTINLPFMLGEELGWRGLMTEESRGLGFWKANLLIGSIWGLWHAPIILLGHNYPNYPYIGILMMVAFCISLSFMFAYIRYKSRTVWGPCVLHGMINGTAAIFLFTVKDWHELYSSIAGLAGILAGLFITLIIAIKDKEFIANYSKDKEEMKQEQVKVLSHSAE